MLSEAAQDVFALVGFLTVAACALLIVFVLLDDWMARSKPQPPYNWQLDDEFCREWVIR